MLVHDGKLNVDIQLYKKTPMIWAHGLMRSMQAERPILDFNDLSEVTSIVRYDARGHGLSSGSQNIDDYIWEELSKDMIAVADALHMDQFIAGGSSMGSATSLFCAIHYPERVNKLLLMHPPTAWDSRVNRRESLYNMAKLAKEKGVYELNQQMKKGNGHWSEPTSKWLMDRSRLEIGANIVNVLNGAAKSDLPNKELLQNIKIPILILAWTDDSAHPISTASEIHELLPQSELYIATSREDVELWGTYVKQFISS